ncbi:MAG: hypothetical protein AAF490_29725 [Chloroflexota bacterium]
MTMFFENSKKRLSATAVTAFEATLNGRLIYPSSKSHPSAR